MRVNEIKETKEVVVRTEYVAEDGKVFYSEEECSKYEESALYVVSNKLKRLIKPDLSQSLIFDSFSYDDALEIFDIKTAEDLDNLKRYLWLKLSKRCKSEESFKGCFNAENEKRKDYVFENVTYGHEVMIFWSYDEDWFWVYKDGSINGFCEFAKENIMKEIKAYEEETNAQN